MIPYRIIEAKRNGATLDPVDVEAFFQAYLKGDVQEYQMAAFLMAVHFRGMDLTELDALVRVMIESGEVLDLEHLGAPRVDKHSTGGVGDKVSLVLAPLVSALGVYVPMMSGRGLGHTGGTLDKLEAIPGMRTDLPVDDFERVLESVGCVLMGQTAEIAPLDRRLYDLRSVTGTVPSIPLIAASIMSKKLAEGLTGLVLDVKVGSGAFVPEEERATELARTMVNIGDARGVSTVALMTAMDRPLGHAVGNALETAEAVEALRGGGPADLREVVLALAAEMILLGQVAADRADARRRAEAALDDGSALEQFRRLVEEQGGDSAVLDDPSRLVTAPETEVLESDRSGWIVEVDPTALGWGVVDLGGGRKSLDDEIDHSVGFVLEVGPGERVEDGDLLGAVHARTSAGARSGLKTLADAILVEEEPPAPDRIRPLISSRVTPGGIEAVHSS